jgi:hypothetical protein
MGGGEVGLGRATWGVGGLVPSFCKRGGMTVFCVWNSGITEDCGIIMN